MICIYTHTLKTYLKRKSYSLFYFGRELPGKYTWNLYHVICANALALKTALKSYQNDHDHLHNVVIFFKPLLKYNGGSVIGYTKF